MKWLEENIHIEVAGSLHLRCALPHCHNSDVQRKHVHTHGITHTMKAHTIKASTETSDEGVAMEFLWNIKATSRNIIKCCDLMTKCNLNYIYRCCCPGYWSKLFTCVTSLKVKQQIESVSRQAFRFWLEMVDWWFKLFLSCTELHSAYRSHRINLLTQTQVVLFCCLNGSSVWENHLRLALTPAGQRVKYSIREG